MLNSNISNPMQTQQSGDQASYWEQTRRDFARNRLAVAALLAILFVLLVAVLCPLLANSRPLYIKTVFPLDLDNSLGLCEETIMDFAEESVPPSEVPEKLAGFDRRVAEAAVYLAEEPTEVLLDLAARFRSMANDPEVDPDGFWDLLDEIEGLYDAEMALVSRFPAFRALRFWEVYTLLLAGGLVLSWPLRRIPVVRRFYWVLVPLAALGGTAAIKQIYPTISDARPYRRMIADDLFRETNSRVIRTIVPYGENENIVGDARQAPTWLIPVEERAENQNWHWLGTDTNGRDVLARMVYGARVSMLIGIFAVSLYTFIGIVLGAMAGYFGKITDILLSRLMEIVICFPALVLILAVQAFLQASLLNIILALAFLGWTAVARLQRAEFLRLRDLDYVHSVRALGGGHLRIIFMHILPNGLGPILVVVSFGIAGSIVVESALSFLGFGVPQPMASWGDLLNNGRNDIQGLWWLTIFPGLAIFFTVTSFNLVGEGIRDALDPKRDQK
ncbi:MAG: ABC transporter permease [Candidatus Sumerlaeia bacterium]|nr:ABC transporter permease [Candidatus Sumerlaeia bacterium]